MTTPPPAPLVAPADLLAHWGVREDCAAQWLTVLEPGMPVQSGSRPVAEAAPVVQAYMKEVAIPAQWPPAAARGLADAGVGIADVFAVLAAREMWWCSVSQAADLVAGALRSMAKHYPDLGVRDALGWALLEAAETSEPLSLPGWVPPRVGPWARRGLAEDGWLYAAAGFSPRETWRALDAGALTVEDARALAGLRGVPLPA